jgi:2-polyprenyl-6-methoxyphenol hydroxylase-like FAD-dependent oxidoreductase
MNGNEHAIETGGTTDRPPPEDVEVAVVGAGPTGLTLAGMLSGYGIRTAVLDSAAGPAPHSRAAVVHARTLETLEPLDVVGEMLGGGVVVPHFGVRDRDRLLLRVDFDGLPTNYPYTLMLPQDRTEHILLGALREHGGRVLWEHEVVGLQQDAGRAELVVRGARGEGRVRARYVVGCDGGHSFARALGG